MNQPAPLAYRVADAVSASGLSRATLYREAAAGRLRMTKAGRTTLVDGASLRNLIQDLPAATIRPARGA